jgi:hypothetical protein
MIELSLGRHARARIWVDDGPAPFDGNTVHLITKAAGLLKPHRSTATVELNVPRGGSVQYGLLGATFGEGHSTELLTKAHLPYPDGDAQPYEGSLIASLETPVAGLPDYLLEGIATTVRQSIDPMSTLVAGTLTFDRAAFGLISSSPSHFGLLAMATIQILAIEDLTDSNARELLVHLIDKTRHA